MSSQPFDLRKMDYEAIRLRKRRKFIGLSLIPTSVVCIVALWFILPGVLTGRAETAYAHGDYKGARSWLTPLTWTSPEPFIIAFNSGTVDSQLGHYDLAETELTRALALAPKDKKCLAAQNLVITLQAHAKTYTATSKEANMFLAKILAIVNANKLCFKGTTAQGGSSSSDNSSALSQAPSDAQQQQLQQKEQAGKDRQAQYAQDETYNPDDPSIKHW